ncbi:hypothetical protein [Vibrio alginolyticus]|uniref:hypothetical protein n=1 Tax=Vibrio alginolyticus TaxID=663 RepID=UPI00211A0FD2|nr:hypothetical protein [Vibrio alginolyticus]MCQ9070322.1 hypothetical protein [Vibrio alginolyticus]
MKILILIPDGCACITSAGIFNYNFISSLIKESKGEFEIELLSFDLGDDYLFLDKDKKQQLNFNNEYCLNSNIVKRCYPRDKNDFSTNDVARKNILSKLKKVFKSFIPDYFVFGFYEMFKWLKVNADKYDVIISFSDPKTSHLFSFLSKFIGCKKSIQVWGDPWYLDITKKTNYIHKAIERKVLYSADFIYFRSSPTKNAQDNLYPKIKNKSLVLHRGFCDEIESDMTMKLDLNSVNFMHAGDYFPDIRDISIFTKCATAQGHKMTLIGSAPTTLKEELNCIKNVSLVPRILPSEVNLHIDSCDCLIVLLNKTGTQIPGKIYDLIPIQKPVILLLDGEITNDDIPCIDRFIVVRNNKEDIESFFINNQSLECSIKTKYNKYHIDNIVKDFIEKVKGIL